MCSAASYQHSVPSLKRSCVTCPFSSLSIIGSIFYPFLVCVQYSVFVLPFRDATVGVVPAFVSVAQARVRHATVGVIPAFVSVAPAHVRHVPGGVVPVLGAVAQALVRRAAASRPAFVFLIDVNDPLVFREVIHNVCYTSFNYLAVFF